MSLKIQMKWHIDSNRIMFVDTYNDNKQSECRIVCYLLMLAWSRRRVGINCYSMFVLKIMLKHVDNIDVAAYMS